MPSNAAPPKSGPPAPKRLKVEMACETCRAKKIKCDAARPACHSCQKKPWLRINCTYSNPGRRAIMPSSPRPRAPTSQIVGTDSSDASEFRSVHFISTPRNFAREVNATVQARFGLPLVEKPTLTPMTDAPLFGLLPRRQVRDDSPYHIHNVLPPRRHADQLLRIYWQYIQPLEPFLDQERFTNSYEALFAGGLIDGSEAVFISSLNTIFALSTQIQERMEPKEREEASETYFSRAWTLLNPGSIIWELGSLEIVQCLLLMGRYLQCTNNSHQTWMAIGSAVRIAQSLGLHIVETPSSRFSDKDKQLRRQLWRCCVFMDQGISWVLGRASMVSPPTSSTAIDSLASNYKGDPDLVLSADFFAKTLELYEINNHIMLSQISPSSSVANRLGLPRLYRDEKSLEIALQLDDCLDKWDKGLPFSLKYDPSKLDADDSRHRQQVMLRLRFLHSRIFLFRPMLARLCFLRSDNQTDLSSGKALRDQVLHSCATICIENSQMMIDLVNMYCQPVESIAVAVIPWWYRIFYLHSASIVLVAAKLRGDLFSPTVSETWDKAISTLHAHERLSPYIAQCSSALQMLSSKITETRPPAVPPDSSSGACVQDIFDGIDLEPDSLLFGAEDISWLTSFEVA